MTMQISMCLKIDESQRKSRREYLFLTMLLVSILILGFVLTLSLGQNYTSPFKIYQHFTGHEVPGVAFTIGQLRFPRAVLAVFAGMCFGLGGVAFQTMLRNPLASPDIIGVSSGASAAAVFAIVVLGMKGPSVSIFAVASGLGVALLVYGLSVRNGAAGTRLILVGIGVSAMLDSVIAYILFEAPNWTLQEAMRWLTGSINGAKISDAAALGIVTIILGGMLLSKSRELECLRLGDDMATALGVHVNRTRLIVIISAVGLIACATSVTGPIAFVAFLSGPIASRIFGNGVPLLIPAALVGAILVLIGDYCGQYLLPSRYPVGVVTGALGAPYLIYLIIRQNRTGGAV